MIGVLDYYKRDGLTMADTDFGATATTAMKRAAGTSSRRDRWQWQGLGASGSRAPNAARDSERPSPINYADA